MKICRFNHDRIGVVEDGSVYDITDLFELTARWPLPAGDVAIAQLGQVVNTFGGIAGRPSVPLSSVRLESPVANPGKIIGAPVNYKAHIDEANADAEINTGKTYTTLEAYGLFLKANSSLIGPHDEIKSAFAERRTDHEVELAVVIGRTGKFIPAADALDYVAGYTVGLDMSLRGVEVPSYRKSADTYSVLGPWLVTPDAVRDPDHLSLELWVNDELRQQSNTDKLILSVRQVIAYASAIYTLHPGDVIMTGTPAGVGPVLPGDRIKAAVEGLGALEISVASTFADERRR